MGSTGMARWLVARSITTHSTGRAISMNVIENLGGFGGPCAPVNSGVMLLSFGLMEEEYYEC